MRLHWVVGGGWWCYLTDATTGTQQAVDFVYSNKNWQIVMFYGFIEVWGDNWGIPGG